MLQAAAVHSGGVHVEGAHCSLALRSTCTSEPHTACCSLLGHLGLGH
jgi:hypothetical protein